MRLALCCLLGAFVSSSAFAEPPAPFEDRVTILRTEMRRGPAADLAPFLAPDADPRSRRLALRALGRIGDHGGAPAMLQEQLERGGDDLPLILWAAGIARTESLAEPIATHLSDDDPLVVAAAAEALGWTGKQGASEDLSPLLLHPSPVVRAAACTGLGRLGAEGYLERVVNLRDAEASVREAAAYARWLLAGARRRAALAKNPDWDGEPRLCTVLLAPLQGTGAQAMAALRPLGSLLPKRLRRDGPFGVVFNALDDPDPRVVQDAVWRVFTRREGPDVDQALARALDHADAKVRHLAAEALGQHATPAAVAALQARFEKETDARMRDVLAVELARVGHEEAWTKVAASADRPADPVVRDTTRAQVLLASKRDGALDELLAWAAPGLGSSTHLHAAVWMAILSGLEGREDAAISDWVGQLVRGHWIADDFAPYVVASAVSLIGKNELFEHGEALKALAATKDLHTEIAIALAGAFEAWAAAKGCPDALTTWIRAYLAEQMIEAESAFVRLAARKAAKAAGVEGVPEHDAKQPTDWRGLPRPKRKILGVSPEGGPWLSEAEILRLADRIEAEQLRVAFQTTAGMFTIELEPRQAPVHCASLVLAVLAGVYEDTRWHRVVPNFVIQGGDPHGHGAGGGGWTVPDEINALRYVPGALGMPKSVKDDGGCQIFVMHTTYRPLDERYTCYARVVDGMDTVNAIRVGDRIQHARLIMR